MNNAFEKHKQNVTSRPDPIQPNPCGLVFRAVMGWVKDFSAKKVKGSVFFCSVSQRKCWEVEGMGHNYYGETNKGSGRKCSCTTSKAYFTTSVDGLFYAYFLFYRLPNKRMHHKLNFSIISSVLLFSLTFL